MLHPPPSGCNIFPPSKGLSGFEFSPVGVKYLSKRPTGIQKLNEGMALCEMLKKAQGEAVFYTETENHSCEVGPYIFGAKRG
jgi:uncharacterized protein (DUF169 family)